MGGIEGKGRREGRARRKEEKGQEGNQDKKGNWVGRRNWMPALATQGRPGAEPQWTRAVLASVQRNPVLGYQGWSPKEGGGGN